MTAVCPINPKHRAFRASGTGEIACIDCQAISKAKRNKFGAQRVETPLGMADSKKEGRQLGELRYREIAGEIADLVAHPKFDLIAWSPDGPKVVGQFTPDASYREGGRLVVQETKGGPTARLADYRLRRRIFLTNRPEIEFRET